MKRAILSVKTITSLCILAVALCCISFSFSYYFWDGTHAGIDFDKVMGMPPACEAPKEGATLINYQPDKKSQDPWVVISDRSDNKLYSTANGTANGNILKFRQYAYVVEQFPANQGDWLHLVKAEVLGRKIAEPRQAVDLGWIRKENVLIWKNSLRSKVSNVHLKAFTLNKLTDIKNILREGKRDILPIYNSPIGATKLAEKSIYEFYFVYKQENDRYLLGKGSSLALDDLDRDIIGWVGQNRIADWSTRLALEPNFEEEAFAERKENSQFQLVAYENSADAAAHANTGRVGKPFWKSDPVTLNRNDLIDRRFPGEVVRFPMLQSFGNTCRTGIIGDIKIRSVGAALDSMKEVLYSKLIEQKDRQIRAKQNFDVIFLVEGTPSMEDYRKTIANMLKKIPAGLPSDIKLRTAVGVYRDEPAGEANLFQFSELSETITNATNVLERSKFELMGDYDQWTAMYFGIDQALLRCGVEKEHTTILFVIGNSGDYSSSKIRNMQATKEKKKSLIAADKISDHLASLNVNMFAIQPTNNTDPASDEFARQTRNLIYESAIAQQELYKKIDKITEDLNLSKAAMPSSSGGVNEMNLTGGSVVGQVIRPPQKGGNFTIKDLEEIIKKNTNAVQKQQQKTEELLTRILDDGAPIKDVSAGVIDGPIAEQLVKLQVSEGLTQKDLINLVKEKYKLYATAQIPLKIKGAVHPTVSYVLFMPEDDLRSYMMVLREIQQLSKGSGIDEQRNGLYSWLVNLAEKYGNLNSASKMKINDVKYGDLMNEYIQGISENSGLNIIRELGLPVDFKIGDLKSPRKFSDEAVVAMVNRISQNTKALNDILSQGDAYPFAYTANKLRYYWIPVKYTY